MSGNNQSQYAAIITSRFSGVVRLNLVTQSFIISAIIIVTFLLFLVGIQIP